jgi:dTDP-4-dehydrorhamnose 3,5-epimerase
MNFSETPLKGAYIIDLDKREDSRGFFARTFCKNEFQDLNLDFNIVQMNNSLSKDKGTMRGLHYQLPPKAETKIVRCINGAVFDVIVDLRKQSETFGKWFGEELNEDNRKMMYVPKGFAHAILTLCENTELFYMVTEFYAPEFERGLRWNDPFHSIKWPVEPKIISEKDKNYPNFNWEYHLNIKS